MCHFLLKKRQGESHEVASQQVLMGKMFFFCVKLTALKNVIRYKITLANRWCDERSSFLKLISHLIIVYKFSYKTFVTNHIFWCACKMSCDSGLHHLRLEQVYTLHIPTASRKHHSFLTLVFYASYMYRHRQNKALIVITQLQGSQFHPVLGIL